jgi:hypothetical protein
MDNKIVFKTKISFVDISFKSSFSLKNMLNNFRKERCFLSFLLVLYTINETLIKINFIKRNDFINDLEMIYLFKQIVLLFFLYHCYFFFHFNAFFIHYHLHN